MRILVAGAGGFIGHHLVKRLKTAGHWVRGVDLKLPEYEASPADEFILGDLRDPAVCIHAAGPYIDELYQLAADMGGAGYIFTGDHDAAIMHNSALINLNMLEACRMQGVSRVFYSSSACIYPEYNQMDPGNPQCSEDSAYPAQPDSEYGWEKLFSERMYLAYHRNWGLNVRIARFHNVFGPLGTWQGGKEKAPAALCRKAALAPDGGAIEVWGDGQQTRTFLYIDECLEGIQRLMRSSFTGPVNIGSTEMVSIGELAHMAANLSGKRLSLRFIAGPQGVRGRSSDNRLIREKLGWAPSQPLLQGMTTTYQWIHEQVQSLGVSQSSTS